MTTRKLDAKLAKWSKRPLKNLTETELQELIDDLREETQVVQETRKAIQSERRLKKDEKKKA